MRFNQIVNYPLLFGVISSALLILIDSMGRHPAAAQLDFTTLATGFSPNPTVLQGTGGGDRPAEEVVKIRNTSTGPCLGYISTNPHEEITLQDNFSRLELRIESESDTTLIVQGPGGTWCNDDSGSKNPAILGEWLSGDYRIWVGAYQADTLPNYELYISDQS